MRPVRRHALAGLLVAAAAPSLADCSIDAFCTQGAPGCVDPGCHDGVKNGTETDVDCGGSCAPCDAGRSCASGSDCTSGHCVDARCCEPPCAVWTTSFGGIVDDVATGVVAGADGAIYVTGRFGGAVDFGGGPLVSRGGADVFVVRLDSAGKHVWSESFGGPLDEDDARIVLTPAGHVLLAVRGASTGVDFGGGPVAATGPHDLYLAELDATGAHVWSRAYSGDVTLGGIALAPDGDPVLVGSFYETLDLGSAGTLADTGGGDVLVVRFSAAGEALWAKGYGDVWGDAGECVAVDAAGDVYVGVTYSRSWSFGGPTLPWANGEPSVAVAKLDGAGGYVWSRGFTTTTGQAKPSGMALDARGDTWVVGAYTLPQDFGTGLLPAGVGGSAFLIELDPHGAPLVAHGYGEHTVAASSVVVDARGSVVVSGAYTGNVSFGPGVALTLGLGQVFVAGFDAAGDALWAAGAGGVAATDPSRLSLLPGGRRVAIAGGFSGTLAFDATQTRTSAGGLDAYAAVLEP